MPEIALISFAGEIPRRGDEQLPDTFASVAENCLLLSGELRGLNRPTILNNFDDGSSLVNAFSLPENDTYSQSWVGFEEQTSFLKGPLVNDAYDRYYKANTTSDPEMNTRARIEAGSPYYLLGTPAPTNVMTVTPDGSGSGSLVTRAYVYTLVSPYGEEGPVSDPVVATGLDDDSWDIANMDTTVPDSSSRPSGYTKRIYRTVTGISGTAAYFFVAEVSLASATYSDTETTDDVALNDTCESLYWQPPPSTLQEIKAHPAGFLVGFTGRDVYFSEPYRPHAWPPNYVISTEHEIVGIGIFGGSIAVITTGFPYVLSGQHPAALSLIRHPASEPCLTHDSIVEMPFGVYYASRNGLQLLTTAGVTNVTQPIITKEEWVAEYALSTLKAARYNDQYVAFYSTTDGFIFAPSEANSFFVELRDHWDVDGIQTDVETGTTIILKGDTVLEWNSPSGEPQLYTWKSKRFVLPRPSNMSAYRLWANELGSSISEVGDRQDYNDARIAYPLNPLGSTTLGAARKYTSISNSYGYQNKSPLGGNILQSLSGIAYSITFNLYADGVLVYSNSVNTSTPHRLPAGYKATRFEMEIVGNADISSVKMSSTGKGLANV